MPYRLDPVCDNNLHFVVNQAVKICYIVYQAAQAYCMYEDKVVHAYIFNFI